MRGYPLTAAIMAASFCVLPARAPSAEDIRPPRETPPASTDANLPYQDVVGALGKEIRSSAGENLGRIVDVLVDQAGQVSERLLNIRPASP